ncbi:MAG: hypothetical protein KIT36_06800 [Alphaproteobacteria bacterium]|nr:hypothetical protein [Alphaproteobacteria bacterium]
MDLSSLMPWRWPRLDPERTRATRAAYDDVGRYDAYHAYCRQIAPRGTGSMAAAAVQQRGYDVVKVLEEVHAANLKERLLADGIAGERLKEDVTFADVVGFPDSASLRRTLEELLHSDIAERVAAYFGCEFLVYSAQLMRTYPVKIEERSLLWHCDRGPREFLKLNLFLDSTAEHGATTEMLSLDDSLPFERAGYTFGPNKRRVADLARIADRIGVAVSTDRPALVAGQAFLFLPARVLHRGIPPSRGVRHMMSLMLMPSPVGWRDAFDRMADERFVESNLGGWLSDAGDLLRKLHLDVPPDLHSKANA